MLTSLLVAIALQSGPTEHIEGFFVIERSCNPFVAVRKCGCEAGVSPAYYLDDISGHRREVFLNADRVNSYGGPDKMLGEWVRAEVTREPNGKQFRMKSFSVLTPVALQMAIYHNDAAAYANLPDAARRNILGRLKTTGVQSRTSGPALKPYLNILCRTADTINITPAPASNYLAMMRSQKPGFDHYVMNQSYGQWSVAGSDVVGWINLPKTTTDYQSFQNIFGGITLWDHAKLMPDIVSQLDPTVDFSKYFGINIFMNTSDGGNGTKYATSYFMTVDGMNRWMPITEDNVGNDVSALCHEDGHNFGFDHSSGAYNTAYDSIWDTMSGGYHTETDSILGQVGVGNGYNAYHRYKNGWIPKSRVTFCRPGETHTVHLERLTDPTNTTDPLMAKIYIAGSSRHYYTAEARKPVGYDTTLPSCVVLHDVLEGRSVVDSLNSTPRIDRSAQVVDPDGNGNPNDASAQWTPGEVYNDAPNGIKVEILSEDATGFNVRITVDASQPQPGVIRTGADDGPGSFRDWLYYLQDVPTAPATFKIPLTDPSYDQAKGFFRIRLKTPLPAITWSNLTIDGASQTAYTGNTNANGPEIMLDGTDAGANACGLLLEGDQQTVRNISVGNFSASGIAGYGATNMTVQSCYLGIEPDGVTPAPNAYEGVAVIAGSINALIGGNNAGNLISGNAGHGVSIWDAATTGVKVYGNLIGTDRTGLAVVPNKAVGIGIFRDANGVTVGGTGTGLGNVVCGNSSGIMASGSAVHDIVIEGNFVGVDKTGKAPLGNLSSGVYIINGATKATIRSNVVSGNRNNEGVTLLSAGTANVLIEKNNIGTDVSGTVAIPNQYSGVWVGDSVTSATITNNLISGNGTEGIILAGAKNSVVTNNLLGPDASGEKLLPNQERGVYLFGGTSGCTIGGASGSENVIGSAVADGLVITDAATTGNHFSGNFVGVSRSGKVLGVQGNGAWIGNGANGNFIGEPGLPNVFGNAKYHGVAIGLAGTSGNILRNNYIGVLKDGTSAPNAYDGITIYQGASKNVIGGVAANEANTLSKNSNGVTVYDAASVGNTIRGNRIFGNTWLGINLVGNDGNYGVTPNDSLDADAGPNGLQNYPVLTSAWRNNGNLVVTGTFNGAPNTTLTVDFYSSDAASASGYGEGATYLGSQTITTSGNGIATISATVSDGGGYLTATATAPDGSTSEFSAVLKISNGLSALTLNPTTVVNGTTSTGTVTLTGPAVAGGGTITLSASPQTVATVPATVVVPAGATSATFTVSTSIISTPQDAIISATYQGVSKTATLHVNPQGLISVSVVPSKAVGGTTFTGAVVTGSPAPPGGYAVAISFDNGAAKSSATVTIPAGSTFANFTITTTPVQSDALVTLTATLGSNALATTFTIQAPQVSALAVNPSAVAGGANATGTVTLTGAAPAGGYSVALSSSQSAVTVAGSVLVPAGSTTATFPISTKPVATSIDSIITASAAGTTGTATLAVTAPLLSSLTTNPNPVQGGASATAVVSISSPAPSGGFVVSIQSDNAAATVPATVTIAAGATSATFTVSTIVVGSDRNVTVSVTAPGAAKSAVLTVLAPKLTSLTIVPSSVVGGKSATGTITLSSAAPSNGMAVAIKSDAASAVVPASVTVLGGATTATFTITTTAVSADVTANITAKLNGLTSSSTLTVTAPKVASLTFNPTSVAGGSSSTATVTLSSAAPVGGATVTLKSDIADATLPASVSIAAGATSATFTVSTTPVPSDRSATISGTFGASSSTSKLLITAPKVSSLQMNPNSVAGGLGATGTVTLSSVAPTGGATVSLSSSQSAAIVPASVTVAAGQTTATFSTATSAVASTVTSTITATYNATTASATLEVKAPMLVSVGFNPSSVVGGVSSTGTVTISSPAPTAGLTIGLQCDVADATVPATVKIAAGATSANFSITTRAVATDRTAKITANLGTSSMTSPLAITAPKLVSNQLNPSLVGAGQSSVATITISSPAPTGGLTIAMASNDASAAVPATVTIAAGATTATATVTTLSSAVDHSATISATLNGATTSSVLTIKAMKVTALTVAPTSVLGGTTATATVTIAAAAPSGGTVVSVSLVGGSASAPSSVTVPAGATQTSFPVQTVAVSADQNVTLSASLNGVAVSTPFVVATTKVVQITVVPNPLIGGSAATGAVSLNGVAPTGGMVVTLASAAAAMVVPKSVTVPAGTTSATFAIKSTAVASDTPVTITATAKGTATTVVTLLAPQMKSLSLNPLTVVGGQATTATITLTGPAPSTGLTLALSATGAVVPATLKVSGGALTGTYKVQTSVVASRATATTTASVNGSSATATATILPPAVTSISLSPTSVKGGTATKVTVGIAAAAPAGGVNVRVTSSGSAADSVTVFIPATKTSGFAMLATHPVLDDQSVILSAVTEGTPKTVTLKVLAPVVTLKCLPSTITSRGTSVVSVNLDGPAPAGFTWTVTASSLLSTPTTITIPTGANNTSFDADAGVVTKKTDATITLKRGTKTVAAKITITP